MAGREELGKTSAGVVVANVRECFGPSYATLYEGSRFLECGEASPLWNKGRVWLCEMIVLAEHFGLGKESKSLNKSGDTSPHSQRRQPPTLSGSLHEIAHAPYPKSSTFA